ncbi:hypothetical protein [Helicobacter jaachi]|nr:hypothetical protein [Helicobacter jaachi]
MSKNMMIVESTKEDTKLENLYQYKDLADFGKIAYIDVGASEQGSTAAYFLYKHILHYVDLYADFKDLRLEDFCALVLPWGIDEHYLSQFRDKILHYLQSGGVVLSFMSNYTRILPFSSEYIASPTPIRTREVKIANSDSARMIFDGVLEYDINHRRGVKGFFNRGYFDVSAFPHEIESILTDSDGRCVGYVDRKSTKGIILSAANADLFSFGLMDNTTARRMGINLLKWLSHELHAKSELKALRENAKPFKEAPYFGETYFDFVVDKTLQNLSSPRLKNLIITGGAAHNRYFFTNKNDKYAHFFSKRCHFLDLDSINLADFDYVVIASRLSVEYLTKYRQKFVDYLESGGHIVSFGEVTEDYLPNILWRNYPVNFWWWLIPGASMPLYAIESDGSKNAVGTKEGLFSKMQVNVAKWHYHGAFYPPKNAQNILVNELGESIIYKDTSFKGHLYVTSLDPDFHLGQGFMPTTEPFFDTFMAWVEEDILATK